MGQRGPLPQPFSTRSQRGEYGPLVQGVVNGEPARLECPADLPELALQFWRDHAPALEDRGLLTPLDARAFETLCIAWARLQRATAELEDAGDIVTTASGEVRPHPAVKVYRDYQRQFVDLAERFGLTPASRARLRIGSHGALVPPKARFTPAIGGVGARVRYSSGNGTS